MPRPKTEETDSKVGASGQAYFDVYVKEARNLQNKDITGRSDPYVIVNVGDEEQKTKVIDDDLNPIWQAHFKFNVSKYDNHEEVLIQFEVMDEDPGQDDFLGEVKLQLAEFMNGKTVEQWYPLKDKRGKEVKGGGELRLKLKYVKAKEMLSSEDKADAEGGGGFFSCCSSRK